MTASAQAIANDILVGWIATSAVVMFFFGGLVGSFVIVTYRGVWLNGMVNFVGSVSIMVSGAAFVLRIRRGSEAVAPTRLRRAIRVDEVPGFARVGHVHAFLWWEDPIRLVIDPKIRKDYPRYFRYCLWVSSMRGWFMERYGMTFKAAWLRSGFDMTEGIGVSWLLYFLLRHRFDRRVYLPGEALP